ncbi:MAG: peroxide stress protein YaaA [Kordiimonadaceae bacterium]|nr:peroxide stress protein YaaA [Kordiimonadaceae bacterium]
MLIVLSPAKKLDFESENLRADDSVPALLSETRKLMAVAKTLKSEDLKAMMGISDKLAELNVARFKAFKTPFTPGNARPALDAFQGDVYVGLDAKSMDDDARVFANQTVRILSGLYGVLCPLDLMQAYRLEMGIKFGTDRGRTLYAFWGELISKQLNKALAGQANPVLVNLASNEYFKAIDKKALKADIITPVFQDVKDGKARVVSFLAKKARGMMTRYAIDKRIEEVESLKDFTGGGYSFKPALSDEAKWVFQR